MAPWEIWNFEFPVEGLHPCVIFTALTGRHSAGWTRFISSSNRDSASGAALFAESDGGRFASEYCRSSRSSSKAPLLSGEGVPEPANVAMAVFAFLLVGAKGAAWVIDRRAMRRLGY